MPDAAPSLTLSPEVSALVREAAESNGFPSPEAFVEAAARAWTGQGYSDEELRRLVDEGEASGDAGDAEEVFARIRAELKLR